MFFHPLGGKGWIARGRPTEEWKFTGLFDENIVFEKLPSEPNEID